jgi:hypothetical protein
MIYKLYFNVKMSNQSSSTLILTEGTFITPGLSPLHQQLNKCRQNIIDLKNSIHEIKGKPLNTGGIKIGEMEKDVHYGQKYSQKYFQKEVLNLSSDKMPLTANDDPATWRHILIKDSNGESSLDKNKTSCPLFPFKNGNYNRKSHKLTPQQQELERVMFS